ncbi:unnamed protein product [Rotaria socialis]|uniref:Uncharacterized protein n=2 Tax=Rotaria socialis TaxID=392032 RepID=A0A818SP55_9BILA|nr:unnamed protein product [Rotaria socialis]
MTDRTTEYILVSSRRKAKKPKQYYYNEDSDNDDEDDEDDNDSQIYGRLVPIKPRKEQRIKYISNDEIFPDYRKHRSEPKLQMRKKTNGDRILTDDDDNIIKVIRHTHTPSASPVEHRRLKLRPRESQPIFYEPSSGYLVSRPSKKNILQTKRTQIDYADDEPTKIMKKVIIDPRTGYQETIYEKDQRKKQRKYYLRPRPTVVFNDSDDEDEQQQMQYVKLIKHRSVSEDVLSRRDPSPKYIMIKKKSNSQPVYTLTSKMPAIKNSRRVVYEASTKNH